jgi:hypothetical protein
MYLDFITFSCLDNPNLVHTSYDSFTPLFGQLLSIHLMTRLFPVGMSVAVTLPVTLTYGTMFPVLLPVPLGGQ